MTKTRRAFAALVGLGAILWAACNGVSGGPDKIVFNETICANQAVVRMELGKTYRLVLDNNVVSPDQNGMAVRLDSVPLLIKGEVPPNSIVGDPFSTVVLSAPPDKESRADVVPTRTGTYPMTCGAIIGGRSQVFDLTLQVIPEG